MPGRGYRGGFGGRRSFGGRSRTAGRSQWSFVVVVANDKTVGEIPVANRERGRLLDLQLQGKAYLRGFNQ